MKRALGIPLVLALNILVGCAALGLATPDTLNQKIAVAYGTVTTIRITAANLLDAKQITAADGENVLTTTDAARAGIDTVVVIAKTDPAAAEFKLNAVRTVLTSISAYLTAKGAK